MSMVVSAPNQTRPGELGLANVTVRYGRTTAVDEVSLVVGSGETVAVTGSNGSGKSSLIRSAIGLAPLASGSVMLNGSTAGSAAGWRNHRRAIAYIPQRPTPGSFPLLVRELLASSGNFDSAAQAAEELGMGLLLDRPLSSLSGGQLQRAYIARSLGCLASGSSVLLADEPTSALDFEGQEQVSALLSKVGVTVLVVTHSTVIAARCDRLFEMAGGHIREVNR